MEDLAGKVAVITGAASGMGLAMAQRFAGAGMSVVLADVEAGPLDAAVADLRQAGHDVLGVPTDVTDAGAVAVLAETAFDRYGSVHVLCNNAGVTKRARSWELTLDDWRWVIDVDLWGVVHGIRSFVPRMVEQGVGHVVNTSSMAGLLPIPNLGAYAAAKSGVLGLTLSLQLEFEQVGGDLQASALCPGWIPTGIATSARNRPAHLADEAAPPNVPRTTSGVVATMSAEDVADQVLDAVRTKRFWILTHDRYREVIREHAARIGTAEGPVAAPIW